MTTPNLVPPHQTLLPTGLTKAQFNFNTAADQTIVGAALKQVISVYRLKFVVAGATVITIKDSAGNTLDGPFSFSASQGMILDLASEPWYITASGTAFVINSSNAVQVGGNVEFYQR